MRLLHYYSEMNRSIYASFIKYVFIRLGWVFYKCCARENSRKLYIHARERKMFDTQVQQPQDCIEMHKQIGQGT